MKNIIYAMVHGIIYLVSLLPYKAMFVISDFLYVIIYRVAGYRRAVVRRNITGAFPEKSPDETLRIERDFYKWLCDYFLETVKMLSVSRDELLRHIEFRGTEKMEEYFDRGQTCAAILGHYCNWELLSAVNTSFKRHNEAVCGLVYHPLRNKVADTLMIKMRQSTGGVCVPKNDVLRYLVSFRRQGLMNLFGYIADQSPKYSNIHLWLDFMNRDTPVFTGAERLMRKMNNAVFYADMERTSRGRYVCTFRLITDNPASQPEYAITRTFFSMLETTIRRNPALYLWSHDRWKRTRAEFEKEYKIENGHTVRIDPPANPCGHHQP